MTTGPEVAPERRGPAIGRRLRPLLVGIALQNFMLWVAVEKLFMTEIGFTAASIGVVAPGRVGLAAVHLCRDGAVRAGVRGGVSAVPRAAAAPGVRAHIAAPAPAHHGPGDGGRAAGPAGVGAGRGGRAALAGVFEFGPLWLVAADAPTPTGEVPDPVGLPAGDYPSAPSEVACRELVRLVTDYLDGALPPTWRDGLDAHLGECDGCTEYLRQIRLVVDAVERLAGREQSGNT